MIELVIGLALDLLIFVGIALGLAYAIEHLFFRRIDQTYRKASNPIIAWCLVFVMINFDFFLMGLNPFSSLSAYIDSQMTGAQALFGNLGMLIAGNQAANNLGNYLHNNAVASNYYERAMSVFMIGAFVTIVVLVMAILTIRSIKHNHSYKKTKLGIFYLISSALTSILIGDLVTMIKAANDMQHYEYEVDNLMPLYWILGTVIAFGLFYFYYISKYKSFLDKIYSLNAVISQPTHSNFTFSSAPTYGDKPTKTCPYCGETILAVAVKCKHCGEWLPKEEEKKMIECMVCGEKVEEGTVECPFCHEKVDGSSLHQYKPEKQMMICPICAEQIPADVEVCPFCNEKIK